MITIPLITLAAAFAMPIAAPSQPVASPLTAMQDNDVQEMARGDVTKIDAANKTFNIKTGAEGAKDVTIAWNDATIFMLEGKVVKWDEVVKENDNLTVTHQKGLATKVEGFIKK